MVLLIHIFIALASVALTTYLFIAPTPFKFRASLSLVMLTIVSGTYLAVSEPAHMLQACVSGLAYISVMLVALITARSKLARAKIK